MREIRSGGVCKLEYTTGNLRVTYNAQRGGAHVSPGVLARLGSTIASMVALAHAYAPLLVFSPFEVRAVNERQWCI